MKNGPHFAEPLQQVDRIFVRSKGRKLIYFGGCDYFRLSSHRTLLAALKRGLSRYGLSASASRKTTGNHEVFEELELAAARFFAAPHAILTSTGFLTNLAVGQGLRGEVQRIFVDERSHASLQDALRFVEAPVVPFQHRSPSDLKTKLGSVAKGERIAVVTDGIFAHNGAVAPLSDYRKIVGRGALLWVDDAHGAGVMGAHGRGAVELSELSRENLIQTVTFSKAFGAYGGAILCAEKMRSRIIAKSSAIAGSTPLPLPLASAALAALNLLQHGTPLRARLFKNVQLFWAACRKAEPEPAHDRAATRARRLGQARNSIVGLDPPEVPTPIIAVCPPDARSLRRCLLQAGIHPPYICYPGGPQAGYFRFALSSEHTSEQVSHLAETLRAAQR
ncbi:MAG TPA: pyridoxal phosphate-dependent aminotransferase family protein [Verrucomicrobiae bacterium]|nr:pyridoxal phosphate-dependent aminotransferase family protein [Verrucomicrobiae bacterium]